MIFLGATAVDTAIVVAMPENFKVFVGNE